MVRDTTFVFDGNRQGSLPHEPGCHPHFGKNQTRGTANGSGMTPSFWIEPGRGDGPMIRDATLILDAPTFFYAPPGICAERVPPGGPSKSFPRCFPFFRSGGCRAPASAANLTPRKCLNATKNSIPAKHTDSLKGPKCCKTKGKRPLFVKFPPGSCAYPLVVGTENAAKSMVFEAKSELRRIRNPAEWKNDPGIVFP